MKKLLYISTNQITGGSEILWLNSALALKNQNYQIKIATYYKPEKLSINFSGISRINLHKRYSSLSIIERATNKLFKKKHYPKDNLEKLIKDYQPNLVILSQGNNVDGFDFMHLCLKLNVNYVTISQLVTEVLWLSLDDEKIETLKKLYSLSKMNFFVSNQNLHLHEKMIGARFENSKIIFNPFIKSSVIQINYPELQNGYFKIALVGRLETYHKGYDLLIEVISKQKWRDRNVQFTAFGSGPHEKLIKRLINLYHVSNIKLVAHVNNIEEIWKNHHLLIMPSRMEGQSLSLIEAMNYKRAAVVTNVGGIDELIIEGYNGFIAEHPTVECIDLALEKAWKHRLEWKEMGVNAYKNIKKQQPEDAVDHYNEQIKEFLI